MRNNIKSAKDCSEIYIYTQTHCAIFIFLGLNHHVMEHTGLWDIIGSEGYVYASFKIQLEEGISGNKN